MAFEVSPVAILELAALEEEAAAAAAEAPAFAALVAAVAAGGVTRRIADNIATYDLSSLRGGVELGGDVLAEAAFGGDGSRAVDHTDVLACVQINQ